MRVDLDAQDGAQQGGACIDFLAPGLVRLAAGEQRIGEVDLAQFIASLRPGRGGGGTGGSAFHAAPDRFAGADIAEIGGGGRLYLAPHAGEF